MGIKNDIREPEEWRTVVGFKNYEVSSHGRVCSKDRSQIMLRHGAPTRVSYKGKLLKPGTTTAGYQLVVLTRNKKTVSQNVHVLVAKAFLGKPPKGKTLVLHWDDVKDNNYYANLRWGTHSENLHDRFANEAGMRRTRNKRGANGH